MRVVVWLTGLAVAGLIVVAATVGQLSQPPVRLAGCDTAATAALPAAPADQAAGLAEFLAAVRTHESGGDYTARNPGSTASGAYQFLDSTWTAEARTAGQDRWAAGRAGDAPADVQDAVAARMAVDAFDGPAQGEWLKVADVWFIGHVAGPAELDVAPPGNGGLTPRAYEAQIAALMGSATPTPTAAPPACLLAPSGLPAAVTAAIRAALAQVGKPYVWGAAGPDAFDCSGLVLAAYASAGVTLPRTTYDQVHAGVAVAQADLAPGDLVLPDPGHVQLYLGGGMVVEAPHTGASVQVVPMWGFWQARRVVPWTPTTAAPSGPAGLARVVSDMTEPNTVRPDVPVSYSFAAGPELDHQVPPAGYTGATGWGVVYPAAGGSPSVNTRVEVRAVQLWLWSRSAGRWQQFQSSTAPAGADYLGVQGGDPFTNQSRTAALRPEPDGGTSDLIPAGYWFDLWPAGGQVTVNPADIGGAYTTFQARLVVDDPGRPADLAAARYVAAAGADWYPYAGAAWAAAPPVQAFYARFSPVTAAWQTFTGISLPAGQVAARPPPVG